VHQHELADVVQQRGDQQPVAMLVAGAARQAVGGALHGHGVQPEALRRRVPLLAALEELEGAGVRRELHQRLGRDELDRRDDRVDLAAARAVEPVRDAQDRDHERDIGLDRAHHVADRRPVLGHERHQPVARLRQRREDLERLEGRREALAVALVARAPDDRVRLAARGPRARRGRQARRDGGSSRCGPRGRHEPVIGR
jgi:hypothetical protein